jgi:hypothetical protein
MEGFSQNTYGYILEECVHQENFFPTSIEESYGIFCPFAFQGEVLKKSKNDDVQMIQNEYQFYSKLALKRVHKYLNVEGFSLICI